MSMEDEELQILRLLRSQSERLLQTRDELMVGPYQQLHGRICAVLGMLSIPEDDWRAAQGQDT